MSKFNRRIIHPAIGSTPLSVNTAIPSVTTYEGATGYVRDSKSELFTLAVVNMGNADSFCELGSDRDQRFINLVREVAVIDINWLTRFTYWLRREANMRSASIIMACEGVHARLAAGLHGNNRKIISNACARADEPGEVIAYWFNNFGRSLPMPVKRGISDAVQRLYTEYSLLKYDTSSHAIRFADVISLCHTKGGNDLTQNALYTYALDRRYGRRGNVDVPASLHMINANIALRAEAIDNPRVMLNTDRLRAAGMTWEDVLSLVGSKIDKRDLWHALIPTMGIFALTRNLKNFDEVGINSTLTQHVIDRITHPEHVIKSRMFPYRWYTAYTTAPSLRWGHALDTALNISVRNIPQFSGRTLVLIDTSGSMSWKLLNTSLLPVTTAAIFGVAIGTRSSNADIVGFATGTFDFAIKRGASLIGEINRFCNKIGSAGHGTNINSSLHATYNNHDRVIIITDQQSREFVCRNNIPLHIPIYAFNVGGYYPAMAQFGHDNFIELGGLTDVTFEMIPLIEAGKRTDWPF